MTANTLKTNVNKNRLLALRLDQKILQLKLTDSRSRAKDLILHGKVLVNGKIITKPAYKVSPQDKIELTIDQVFVSRAAEKLQKALEIFKISPEGKICLDIGSSTGGFTQVLLLNKAKKIYAVDVGTEQLHPKLRNNPRIILLENTDARQLDKNLIPEPIELFVSDVSFISITKILPHISDLLSPNAHGVILIKPQFELSPQEVKKGVVKAKQSHIKAIENVLQKLEQHGFSSVNLWFSPIKGGDGNIEFLAHILYNNGASKITRQQIQKIVDMAHKQLN